MTLNSFFIGLRQLALTIAIMALIPALSYWTARLVNGGSKSNLEWVSQPRTSPQYKETYKELEEINDNINVLNGERRALLSNESAEGRKNLEQIDKKLTVWHEKKDAINPVIEKIEEAHRQKFAALRLKEAQTLFLCSTIIGLASIVFGVVTSITYLGAGFIIGGLISLSMGYYFYWHYLYDLLKFISLIAALLLILLMSYSFMKKQA